MRQFVITAGVYQSNVVDLYLRSSSESEKKAIICGETATHVPIIHTVETNAI